MELTEIIREIQNRKNTGELGKRRVACAHCGSTWIELAGLIIGHKEGSEDLCLRVGLESENCQVCRYRPLECQVCGSKDVYEIRFNDASNGVPLSFTGIKRVNRSSGKANRS